jgi:hypothetical protein
MKNTLKNLEKIFGTKTSFSPRERKFWTNCLTKIQNMKNGHRILKRIANASDSDVTDYLIEVWYSVLFSELGFGVVIEPLGKAGPDLEVTMDDVSSVVEITGFRKIYAGPPELPDNVEDFVLTEYGDSRRDTEKVYNKIIGKFPQINQSHLSTSIIALWNNDGDLEEIEMQAAIEHLRRDSLTQAIVVPESLAFVLFAPWDNKILCFPVRSLTSYERNWIEKVEEMSIAKFKDRILYME